MTKNAFLIIILCCCFSSACFAQVAGLQKIVLIRHAEKPASGDNLSCQGFNRAKMLASILDKKFGVFNYIFVPALSLGKSTKRSRMFETVLPYAIKYNIEINTNYDEADFKGAADGILKKNGNVLLVWEHKNISGVVKALGINDKGLDWADNDFDSIWIIRYVKGKAILSKDKENINPPSKCD